MKAILVMKGDCETISRLMEEKVRLEQRSVMLDRLLFEVSRKFPCETRFDTALRYIREAENLIEFQGAMRQPGSKGLSDDEWSLREAHYTKSQHLNQRGIAA